MEVDASPAAECSMRDGEVIVTKQKQVTSGIRGVTLAHPTGCWEVEGPPPRQHPPQTHTPTSTLRLRSYKKPQILHETRKPWLLLSQDLPHTLVLLQSPNFYSNISSHIQFNKSKVPRPHSKNYSTPTSPKRRLFLPRLPNCDHRNEKRRKELQKEGHDQRSQLTSISYSFYSNSNMPQELTFFSFYVFSFFLHTSNSSETAS